MNSNYNRVIPRDLFNEAKLLKCIGRLCLLIHDRLTPVPMTFRYTGNPFRIALMDEGSLCIMNLDIYINDKHFRFKTTYNSKSNYPLLCVDGYKEYPVFNDDGTFDQEFIDFTKTLM